MTSPLSLQPPRPTALRPDDAGYGDECERQFAAAQREMGAFVTAVGELFGRLEAARAAECWIELAESMEAPLVDGYPNWRRITITAVSQLAKRSPPDLGTKGVIAVGPEKQVENSQAVRSISLSA